MLYSCCSLSAVYYLFTAYTERAFLQPVRLFKHPLRAFGTKETITMNEPQLLDQQDENIDLFSGQPYAQPADTDRGNGLAKVAIGAVVGAVVGALAAALTNKRTVESINHSVKGVGDVVKNAAQSVNQTVKDIGDAVNSVADNVNHTAKGVGDAVKDTAEGVNHTVKGTVDTVKGAAQGVNHAVKGTVDAVKNAAEDVNYTVKGTVDAVYQEQSVADNKQVKTDAVGKGTQVETQTTYMLVPVDK
jgi:gas vesicle protein